MAKVLLLNGSPRAMECTGTALQEMVGVFEKEGIETEVIQVGSRDIRGCTACGKCRRGMPGILRFSQRHHDLISGQTVLQFR